MPNLKVSLCLIFAFFISGCAGGTSQATANNTPHINNTLAPAALPAKITLESAPMIMDPSQVPPEPDKTANNATLAGVDSNNNGIRDDVERWIARTYDTPQERSVVAQTAKALQATMYFKSGQYTALDTYKILQAALVCTIETSPDGKSVNPSYVVNRLRKIQSRTYNTTQRLLAHQEEGQNSVGVLPSENENNITKENACEINWGVK